MKISKYHSLLATLLTFLLIVGVTYRVNGQAKFSSYDHIEQEKKAEVLILGTTHLSEIEDSFSSEMLDSLILQLRRFNPDAIGIEALSGEQITAMQTQPKTYKPVLQQFAGTNLNLSKKVTFKEETSWEKAKQKADSLLALNSLIPEQRVELIKYLLASYQTETAVLQWSYLSAVSPSKPQLADSISHELLSTYNSADEVSSIGLQLAHTLSHKQIHPIDDHTEKDQLLEFASQLMRELPDSIVSSVQQAPHFKKVNQLIEEGLKNGSLFELYRYINSDTFLSQDVDAQWKLFLRTNLSSNYDKKRLALWEVRNLNIAAHIQKLVAKYPTGKILIIIGVSHKAFLDDYLNRMMNVEIIQLQDL